MEVGPDLSRHFNVFSAAPEQTKEAASAGEVPDPEVIDYFL